MHAHHSNVKTSNTEIFSSLCFSTAVQRCPPRQKSRLDRLRAKLEPLLTSVTADYFTSITQISEPTTNSCWTRNPKLNCRITAPKFGKIRSAPRRSRRCRAPARDRGTEACRYIYMYIYICMYIYIYTHINKCTHICVFHSNFRTNHEKILRGSGACRPPRTSPPQHSNTIERERP